MIRLVRSSNPPLAKLIAALLLRRGVPKQYLTMMNLPRAAALRLLMALLSSLVFTAEASKLAATIDEFAIPYPEPPRCPSQASRGTHPESTHEITYDPSAPRPSQLWVMGQNDDAIVRIRTEGVIHIYAVPPCSGPHGITFDRAGRLWVSLEFAGKVVQLQERAGRFVEAKAFDVRLACAACNEPLNTHPHGLAVGPDGKTFWFTGKATGTVGKISPDGTIETFGLPTVGSVPIYIRAGPDGNMWFTVLRADKVGRLSTSTASRED